MNKHKLPSIIVEGFETMNNVETQQIALHFESGDLESALVFTISQAKELVIGLEKSLKRIKERES